MADLRPWILTVAALGLAACDGDGAFAPRPDRGPDVTATDGDVEVEVDDGDAERPDGPDVIDDAAPPGDDDARPPDNDERGDRDRPWERDPDPYDLDFEIPRSEAFPPVLSAFGLYRAPMAALQPSEGVVAYGLASALFTDHAHKQRLLRVPDGATVAITDDGRLAYPEGTVLAKTFYYPDDMGNAIGPRRIIETRLLVMTAGAWNVATYLWNAEQSDATLLLMGTTTAVSWLDEAGRPRATDYAVPHEGECVTCHQLDGVTAHIGPTLRNLNRTISLDGAPLNQLDHLVAEGVLDAVEPASAPTLPDYDDDALPLADRARAYLDINCAHCHNPGGWEDGSDRRLDLRYSSPVAQTNLVRKRDDLIRVLKNGKMPYLGTTLVDEVGIGLVIEYVRGL